MNAVVGVDSMIFVLVISCDGTSGQSLQLYLLTWVSWYGSAYCSRIMNVIFEFTN